MEYLRLYALSNPAEFTFVLIKVKYQQKALSKGLVFCTQDRCLLLAGPWVIVYLSPDILEGGYDGATRSNWAFTCPFKYLPHFGDPLSQVGMETVEC